MIERKVCPAGGSNDEDSGGSIVHPEQDLEVRIEACSKISQMGLIIDDI